MIKGRKNRHRFPLASNCIDMSGVYGSRAGELVREMVAKAVPITYGTMTRRTEVGKLAHALGYDRRLPLSRDWHVGYFKSTLLGEPVYFMRWSGIEYVFTSDGTCPDRSGQINRRSSGVILFSGGLDSVMLALLLKRKGQSPQPVYMSHRSNVGNVTKKELKAASKLARSILGKELLIVKAPAKGKEPSWYGQYGDVVFSTRLPVEKANKDQRNRVFLRVLKDLGLAGGPVALGLLDSEATPKNRKRWADIRTPDLERFFAKLKTGGELITLSSLGYDNKVEALEALGRRGKIPAQLWSSESCLMYFNRPCGDCASCKARAEAFLAAWGEDKTPYRPKSVAGKMKRKGRANRRGRLAHKFPPKRKRWARRNYVPAIPPRMYHLTRNPRWKPDPKHSPYIAIGTSTSHEDPGTLYVTESPIYWRSFLGAGPLFLVVLDTSRLKPHSDYTAPHIETYPQYLLAPHAIRVEEVLPLAQAIRKGVTDPNRYPVGSIEDWWDYCEEDWDIPPYDGQLVCTLLKGTGMGKLRKEWREKTGFRDPDDYFAAHPLGRRAYKFPPKRKPWVSPHMEQLREDLYAAGVPRSTDVRIEAYPPGHDFEGFTVAIRDSAESTVAYEGDPRCGPTNSTLGYFRVTRVNEKGFEWLNAPRECYQALKRLRRKQPHIQGVWVVPGAELFDPRLRGKGIGRVMYRHALEAADRAGAALMPHECLGGGTTSPAAKKAWQSLPGDQEGWIHYLPRGKRDLRGRRYYYSTGWTKPMDNAEAVVESMTHYSLWTGPGWTVLVPWMGLVRYRLQHFHGIHDRRFDVETYLSQVIREAEDRSLASYSYLPMRFHLTDKGIALASERGWTAIPRPSLEEVVASLKRDAELRESLRAKLPPEDWETLPGQRSRGLGRRAKGDFLWQLGQMLEEPKRSEEQLVATASVGDRLRLTFPKVRGAPRRKWMKDATVYRVTGRAKRRVARAGSIVEEDYGLELEPVNPKHPKATLYTRVGWAASEGDSRVELDVMLALYGKDGLGHTTGHPVVAELQESGAAPKRRRGSSPAKRATVEGETVEKVPFDIAHSMARHFSSVYLPGALPVRYNDQIALFGPDWKAGGMVYSRKGQHLILAGSMRRQKEHWGGPQRLAHPVGDLDFVVAAPAFPEPDLERTAFPNKLEFVSGGDRMRTYRFTALAHGKYWTMQVNLMRADPEELGATLLYATGPGGWNAMMRVKAKRRGFKLNRYGLFDVESGEKVAGKTEKSIFKAMGKAFKAPWERGK